MRITVRNLGIIKEEATIDLKPLTIFIGPNNAGKTWLAYALAGVFSLYGLREYIRAYNEKQIPDAYEPLNKAVEQVLEEGNATIDLRRFADDYGEQYFNNVANYARTWMGKYFSTQLAQFKDMDISLSLANTKAKFLQRISQYSQRTSLATGSQGASLTIRKTRGEDKVYIFTATEQQDSDGPEEHIDERIPAEEVKERIVSFVLTTLQRSLYPQVCIFPTERTTLVAARFSGRIVAGGEASRVNQKAVEAFETLVKELDIRTLAEQTTSAREAIWPVGSFMSMLSSVFRNGVAQKETRERIAKNDPNVKAYIQLAEVLEKQVLAGNIDFSTPEPDPRREVLFQPTQDVTLEIPIASSMVKELSPLVLYLRYLAQPGELVIIDEPEMNLHPEAQAKIIEFLAMLVNAGLNVLFTTHSPYITDHLSNLIKANESEEKETIRNEFYLKRTDAFISKELVSVYGINEGKVSNVLDEDGLINWSTFGDVSEHIINLYMKL